MLILYFFRHVNLKYIIRVLISHSVRNDFTGFAIAAFID